MPDSALDPISEERSFISFSVGQALPESFYTNVQWNNSNTPSLSSDPYSNILPQTPAGLLAFLYGQSPNLNFNAGAVLPNPMAAGPNAGGANLFPDLSLSLGSDIVPPTAAGPNAGGANSLS